MDKSLTKNIEADNLAVVRTFLAALETGAVGDTLARFFAPNAVQVELPNRVNPRGGQSDLPTLLKRAEQGQKLLRRQTYALRSTVAQDSRVAAEVFWSAVLAVPVETLPAGATMKGHLAMFFEFAEGRIVSLRNYDCFEPW